MKELVIATWPDQKRPTLNVKDVEKNHYHILAYFKNAETAAEFAELAKCGLRWGGERKDNA